MPHINYYYDFTVTAFIVHNNKVLLVNHPRYGKWIPVGGHIEPNEDPDTALFREVEEETGLTVSALGKSKQPFEDTNMMITPNFIDVHDANPPHKHISLVYFCVTDSDLAVKSDEHDDMKWLTEEELADQTYGLSPSVTFYALEAIKAAKLR